MNAIWFRHDLRLHDHQPFLNAVKNGEGVHAVFVWDERFDEEDLLNMKRIGANRRRFLIESLEDLATSLHTYGIRLTILHGKIKTVLSNWLIDQRIEHVFVHDHPGFEERQDLSRLMAKMSETNWHVSEGHMLFRRDQLPVELAAFPMSFTRFRKKIETKLSVPKKNHPYTGSEWDVIQEASGKQPEIRLVKMPIALEELKDKYPGSTGIVKGGETAGLERLHAYVDDPKHLFTYKETRDGLLSFDDSSKLSFWLSNGCLSPKRVYQTIMQMEAEHGRNESSYWLFFELLWREYFQWLMLATQERLFLKKGLLEKELIWHDDLRHFEAWKKGETGYPLVDAAMVELNATGYMSNRARQNVASFLTKNLAVNWLWGAKYFEEQLIDYDPASNYGNWAYQAGVGTDMRELRAFNVVGQGIRYDPKGRYAKHWLKLPESLPGHVVYNPEELRKFVDWPQTIVDQEESLRKRTKELGLE
ncbi:DASH family cryptochrome [Carnobacterium sp. ISL-102]|uniref:DASH family cryptochrome n=1 Tax=Carnobacterium sp. ISL-102 TaxID=2819142 RepID=UPI001BEBAFF1|nr:DASH family cryptochrome [Carnobacterium sp. ISL-102]MBT2732601.1 DASH family cryptochrome [Carnobacterium sp. ISL-102]